jgi:HD-GYP domain-containing protein (c-di-GMP phosphodiesterase class II)
MIDALPAEVAVLNSHGTLIAINRAWKQSALENDPLIPNAEVGANYVALCDANEGENRETVRALVAGVRSVLKGESEVFELECCFHSPGRRRWLQFTASPALVDGEPGAILMYIDVSERRIAEEAQRQQTQRRLDEQAARLSALAAIDRTIRGTEDLQRVANELLKQLREALNLDAAALLLVDRHLKTLDFTAGYGFLSDAIRRVRFRIGEGVVGQAALTKTPVIIPTLPESPVALMRPELLTAEGFVGYAVIPLVAKGEVTGILEVLHRRTLTLSAEQWEFLEALASQAALAIDNARLFDDLQRSNADLVLAYDATIEGWARALDLRDNETEGHSRRVTERTLQLAEALDVAYDELAHVRRGALLHDIGKMGIPDSILSKPGPLTPDEWEVMRKHPVYAYEMLSPIAFLRPALPIPYCHHEKWDGTGYPQGLKGEQIPFVARIFAVVDVWDALRFDRPYRRAWLPERVHDYLRSQAGSHFDPRVVEAFLLLDRPESL